MAVSLVDKYKAKSVQNLKLPTFCTKAATVGPLAALAALVDRARFLMPLGTRRDPTFVISER